MNETERRLREFWKPAATNQTSNPDFRLPNQGYVQKPVDWAQSNFQSGSQGVHKAEVPPIKWR